MMKGKGISTASDEIVFLDEPITRCFIVIGLILYLSINL